MKEMTGGFSQISISLPVLPIGFGINFNDKGQFTGVSVSAGPGTPGFMIVKGEGYLADVGASVDYICR